MQWVMNPPSSSKPLGIRSALSSSPSCCLRQHQRNRQPGLAASWCSATGLHQPFMSGASPLLAAVQCRCATRRKQPQAPQAAAQYGQMEGSPNRRPPGIVVKVVSALFYMIPWMDVYLLGREMYHRFPHTLIFYYLGKPLMPYYFMSQWTPLVLFFLMYLYVIRNTKFHHFMRFNCMQAIMLDIITMVFNLLRSYFPSEFRWSILMDIYDMFAFNACMCTIVYCMFYALRGRYADIPYVSESVYLQVEPSL